ncbi:MAG: PAS domain S-box protein [Pirellulales bacterium]|nr:PAS domain S-box protein [Pirellulales bacterium]
MQNASSIAAARQRTEERLRAVFSQAAVGIAIADLDGKLQEVNARFCEIFGYTPEELRTRTFMALTHPDDLDRTRENVGRLLAGEIRDFTYEKRYLRKDGSSLWSLAAVTLLRDSGGNPQQFIGVIEDISARKHAEEALKEEARILEILNETGRTLASTLDVETLLQSITDAATELSGAQFGAFFYNTVDDNGEAFLLFALSGAKREEFEKFGHPRATPLFGPTFRGEGPIRISDVLADPRYGQWGPHHGMPQGHLPVRSYMSVPVISRSGEVIGGLFFGHSEVGVFTERAERIVVGVAGQAAVAIDNARLYEDVKRAAAEREQLLEAERAARAEAERVSLMKDEFLATLSHELRTPLNAILGWSQLIAMGDMDDDELRQGLETIERNARAQTQLIEDLLDMSRIISGKVRLDVQRVDLAGVVDAAVDSVQPSADAKGIRLRKIVDPLAGPVSGDPMRMQQVVWNLLSNAVKFTPKNGTIDVLLERVNSHLEITVHDSGAGIKPEFLPWVFERFRQADSSTTRKHGGLGLGLSIVKQLVELHGGTVRAKSAGENQGATFIVALPLAPIRSDENRDHPAAYKVPGIDCEELHLDGLKVLVVDDEPDARHLIKRVLKQCHAEVTLAAGADEALAALKAVRPDVIISDVGMPGKDGYQFIREVRSLMAADGGHIPAIALTAFARSEDRTRAMLAGYQVHMSKPIEPHELLATIASLAGRMKRAD